MTDMLSIRAMLAERFPLCFAGHGHKKRPLALGIHIQLAAVRPLELSMAERNEFVDWYCQSVSYTKAVAAGGSRVNLDGSPAGDVDINAISLARASLAKRDRLERERAKLKAAEALLRDIRGQIVDRTYSPGFFKGIIARIDELVGP